MFQGACSIPKKILCSTAYSIAGGETVNVSQPLSHLELRGYLSHD